MPSSHQRWHALFLSGITRLSLRSHASPLSCAHQTFVRNCHFTTEDEIFSDFIRATLLIPCVGRGDRQTQVIEDGKLCFRCDKEEYLSLSLTFGRAAEGAERDENVREAERDEDVYHTSINTEAEGGRQREGGRER